MEKIRFGVVGTNFITDWVIAGARQDSRFSLDAVCSRRRDTGEAFASRHGIPKVFTSLEEMASSPDIDAVYIATPNSCHAEQSILCMSLGKHVLCEKPLASNAEEARRMIRASERYGVALMEAMKPVLTPNFSVLRRAVEHVGTVRSYFSSFCQYSSRYDRYKAGELPNAFNPVYSNGALMDIGVYTIYPMVVLFGMPLEVKASGLLLPSGVDGQGSAVFRYEGMEASVMYSKISDSFLPTEIQGEGGTVIADRIGSIGKVTFIRHAASASGGKGRRQEPEDITAASGMDEYYYEVAEFMDLIQSGRRESAVNSHHNSLCSMLLLDEIRRQTGVVFPADSVSPAEDRCQGLQPLQAGPPAPDCALHSL